MKRINSLLLIILFSFFVTNAFAQTRKVLDTNKVYYIKINDLSLADMGVDFDPIILPVDEVFTGNARPTMQEYKEGDWSQLWYFEDKGDSYTVINYKTNRYVWTDARLPKADTQWSVKDWADMPSAATDRLLYMGPSGESVELGGWNNFKIMEESTDGKVYFAHVWGDAIYNGYFKPDNMVAGSFLSMPKELSYDWEIVEAYAKDNVPGEIEDASKFVPSADSVYYIKINDLSLADMGVDFNSGILPVNEVFTGNSRPNMQEYKEGDWSQLWHFEDKGDSYTVVNYKTNRYVWTNARLPKVDTQWNAKDWAEMPWAENYGALYMGPSGESVELGGWNNFRIMKGDISGKCYFAHVWSDDYFKGYFKPESMVAGSFISMPKALSYDWEIVKAYAKESVPTSVSLTKQPMKYRIVNNAVVSPEPFRIYSVDGRFITSSSIELSSGIYIIKFSAEQVEKIMIY